MTKHDEARLERAHDALAYGGKPATLEALRKRVEMLGDALAGIQSTDDPGIEYRDAHQRLLAAYAEAKADVQRKIDEGASE